MLCYAMLCYAMLCSALLCNAIYQGLNFKLEPGWGYPFPKGPLPLVMNPLYDLTLAPKALKVPLRAPAQK